MEFEREELSGHLRSNGITGDFWILELAWTYLERVTPTPAGPNIEKLGTFHDVEDAKIAASLLDNGDTEAYQMFLDGQLEVITELH